MSSLIPSHPDADARMNMLAGMWKRSSRRDGPQHRAERATHPPRSSAGEVGVSEQNLGGQQLNEAQRDLRFD